MFKKSLIILTLLLSSIYSFGQFGHTVFPSDSVTIIRKLRILNVANGALTDSIITHKANGSITKLGHNQLRPTWLNIQSRPTSLSQFTNDLGFLDNATASSLFKPISYIPTWSEVTGKPTLFSGDYNDLINKPVIPTNTNQLVNGAGFLTSISSSQISAALGFTPYNGTTNPNGYISSYTETDPTVPSYAKSLTGFSSIKSSTDPLYKASSYVPDWAEITSKPTLFSGNYNDLTNRPTIPAAQVNSDWNAVSGVAQILNKPNIPTNTNQLTNGAGFITGVTSSQITSALGFTPYNGATNPNGYLTSAPVSSVFGRTGPVTAQTGDYTTTQITEGTNQYFTTARARSAVSAGTGISYDSATGVITSTASATNLTGSNGITVTGTAPNFTISQTTPTYNNAPARTLGTSFRPSTVRPTRVSYTVAVTTALSLLNLNSSGVVALQISSDNTNWVTINSAGVTKTLAVSISVGLNETQVLNVAGEIPAGWYCRLQGTTSGGGTVAFQSGQETIY